MRSALTAHPELLSTGAEDNIVGDLLEACDLNATVKSRRFAMQVSEETHEALFAQLMLDLVFPDLDRIGKDRRLMISTWLTPQSAQRATKLFPGAQFVLIVRDGVATVESRLAHHTFGQQTFEAQCEKWASWGMLSAWAQDRADCLIIRHEHLIADPGATIACVMDFLRLPQSSAPAATLRTQRFHPTPQAQRPRWQTWTDADCETFERICSPTMHALGYPIPWQMASAADS